MTVFYCKFTGNLPAGDIWVTGFHVLSTSDIDTVEGDAITFRANWWNGATAYADLVNAGTVVVAVTTYQLAAAAPYHVVGVREGTFDHPGTNANPSLPQNSSPLASLRTGNPGPAGRGRMYLPPIANDGLAANGDLLTATATKIRDSLLAGWTASNSGTFTPVIFHRATGGANVITEFQIPNVMAVQRRRTNKVDRAPIVGSMP